MARGGCIYFLTINNAPINIPLMSLVSNNLTVKGSITAERHTVLEMLKFSERNGIRPDVEVVPLSKDSIQKAMVMIEERRILFRVVFEPMLTIPETAIATTTAVPYDQGPCPMWAYTAVSSLDM